MDSFVQTTGNGRIVLENKNSLECYAQWPAPTVIFVDGPYGINGFPGDPKDTRKLPEVYAPPHWRMVKICQAKHDAVVLGDGTRLGTDASTH